MLMALFCTQADQAAATTVVRRLARISPGLRVAIVDGQSDLRTLVPLRPIGFGSAIPHLPMRVTAVHAHERLGHHLSDIHVLLDLDDCAPEGYLVACLWGHAANRAEADLGDLAGLRAVPAPVDLRHYFLRKDRGGVSTTASPDASGLSLAAWAGVDPIEVADDIAAIASGHPRGMATGIPVDLTARIDAAQPTHGPPGLVAGTGQTVVVDAAGAADFTTLTQAVATARSGTRILVRPGHYQGPIVVQRLLHIAGEGDPESVVVSAAAGNVIDFRTAAGSIENLTLQHLGTGQGRVVQVHRGRLALSRCLISGRNRTCVEVADSAEVEIRHCDIHDGSIGVLFDRRSGGTLVDNRIHHHSAAGLAVGADAAPGVRDNVIERNAVGVLVQPGGAGDFHGNTVRANTRMAWSITRPARSLTRSGNTG